ncbi:uncharacterized protein LOC133173403 isoform X2 [Saccostrea echinata]|uniref:uncharacterized protein LOC133173403 isoform X2 n=1 Tax=Saccostrea echinata TaxID=191078 RepID=UPI002A800C19|nr:uncharacterized protein LOC133173403 isoform X2 [Saccostrea echinata]
MISGKITVRHARGIVVGCAGAGKTTMLYRLIGKTLEEMKEICSTRGLQIYEYVFTVKDGTLRAGKEQSQSKQLICVPKSALKRKDKILNLIQDANFNSMDVEDDAVNAKEGRANSKPLAIDLKDILDERENETSVSMIDFAGQFAYYACHQIYMRSEAFYTLVLDMTKGFEDVVSSEKDERKGSVFSTWTYKDYLRYWVNSIKTFGGSDASVLLVATHAEGKTKDEIEKFFESFWRVVPEEDISWLYKSINGNEFAIGPKEMNEGCKNSLQSIKSSIADVVSRKLDTKFEVPSSWALLEHYLKKLKQPLLSTDEIKKVNNEIPDEYQLKTNEEILDFLKFYHAHGIFLYFEEDGLNKHVILGIQWFSNAFSRIIADKNHVTIDCKRRYIKEWECFNETGELKDTLLEALWKEEPLYVKHKFELVRYMERLRMLVVINATKTEMSWYVPCMNRKPFKKDIFEKKWSYSSILCFRFNSFAMFVFYRLVAYCMSFLGWRVASDKGTQCLYHTAAVFEHQHHTVILGICDDDIQLQVMCIAPLQIKSEVCHRIGNDIELALLELTKIFAEKKNFQRGFKCRNIICNEKDLSFIPESELFETENETVQCMHCPIGEKHEINVHKTLRFWKQKEPMPSQFHLQTKSSAQKPKRLNVSTHSEPKTKLPKTGPMYPFSKTTFHRDVMTSQLKAEVSRSVGMIYIDGHPTGTGFRVGDKYIMTCLHVIESTITEQRKFMDQSRIFIQFERKLYLQDREEKDTFKFKRSVHYVHDGFDVAILELKKHRLSDVEFPPHLSSFSKIQQFPSEVHLVGHPGGVQMKEDSEVYPGVIKPNNDVDKYIEELSQWSVNYFPDGVDYYRELRDPPRKILFRTTFNQGSSGSPGVILRQQRPSVVLIIRGGTPGCFYENKFQNYPIEDKNKVEYGYAMEDIHQDMHNSQNKCIRKLASEIFKEWI